MSNNIPSSTAGGSDDPATTSTAAAAAMTTMKAAVAAMGHEFFDVTIICTTDDHQANYWMNLLENGLLSSSSSSAAAVSSGKEEAVSNPQKIVLAVSEDWDSPGGAGNGLGTLYAWEKACALASVRYPDFNLPDALATGQVSAALYHTAGKGTRMAPLPASENNNKPGVKLPFAVQDGTATGDNATTVVRPITVLESVIRQTGIYAAVRKGRLSVFWGDQVFLPTTDAAHQPPTHHADILCTLLGDTAPTAEEWSAQGLDKYGVIAVVGDSSGTANGPFEAAQVEKVSHETATAMLSALGSIRQVGPSLGSFSVSAPFLQALCTEFAPELTTKTAKFDTDPHFWMPLTLPRDSYVSLMQQKGTDESTSAAHYDRMAAMKISFLAAVPTPTSTNGGLGLFGAVDVGKNACWWDYGQLTLYHTNTRLLLQTDNPSAELLRSFLGIANEPSKVLSSLTGDAVLDDVSYVFLSKLGAGTVHDSLLSRVAAPTVKARGAIIVNCASTASITAGPNSILYNIIDDTGMGITAADGEVVVGVTDESGVTSLLRSRLDIDGGKAWSVLLNNGNECTFEQVHKKNFNANIGEISAKRSAQFDAVAQSF